MVYKFNGTLEEFRKLINGAGLSGKWTDNRYGVHRFRSNDGGALSWWPSNGSVQVQGQSEAKSRLENVFVGKLAVPRCAKRE
jgi:hypothetical protein